jgi:hypothetical protein
MVITYYQRTRHLFGKLKLEVFDESGKLVDTPPASKRPGINRVNWSMNVKPPRVPPAASVAGSATQGPRVVPGTYTVRMTKGDKTYETKVQVGLDPRSPFTAGERKAQFDAAMKVHAMFGEMSDLVAQILAARRGAESKVSELPESDPLRARLTAVADKADVIRKKIVATKEGGAITGEERLREYMDDLYGGILTYEGKPTATLLARTDVLRRELGDVQAEFEAFRKTDMVAVNSELKSRGLPEITLPEKAPVAWDSSAAMEEAAALTSW